MRIDKYLWCVRLFKTRKLACEACKKNNVIVNDINVKSSKQIIEEDIIKIKYLSIWRTYRVKELLTGRISAKLVPDFLEEITPKEELEKLEETKSSNIKREKGKGRPTKKERRELDKIKQLSYDSW